MYELKYLQKIRDNENVPLLIPKGFKFIGPAPFRHQIVTMLFGLAYNDLAIFSTMGTGKTAASLFIARYRIQAGEIDKVLVVCPSSVLGNWKNEVDTFTEHSAIILHHSNRGTRLNLFTKKAQVFIINYEGTFRFLKQILKLDYGMVIFDESSRISNPKAKQTQACMEIAGHSKYRILLNGTPVANKPLDLWSQMYCLDFGDSLGKDFKIYRSSYFSTIKMKNTTGQYFSVYKIRNKASLDIISSKIAKKSIRYTKEECIKDLPEKLYQTRTLELPLENRKLYEQMYDNARLEISKLAQNISAHILLTKFIKALQICSGYVKTDEGNFIKLKKNPKLDELKNLIEEIVPNDAIVVWCKHLFTIDLIEKMLTNMGLNYLVIRGAVKDKSGVANLFQTSSIEDIPILIGQIQSGGIGLNLHKASYEIFVENAYRLLDREQAEDRCHRIGSKKNVTIIDLVVKNSIDEQIIKAIKQKQEIANYILKNVR